MAIEGSGNTVIEGYMMLRASCGHIPLKSFSLINRSRCHADGRLSSTDIYTVCGADRINA